MSQLNTTRSGGSKARIRAHRHSLPSAARSTMPPPTRTRVELEHRHIDRHGPGWEAITGGVDGPQGWPLYLDRYAALLKEGR